MKFCCDNFAKEAGALQAMAGGGFLYPPEMRHSAQFHRYKDGMWAIAGCCGGGCDVVSDMKFCPFCGAPVPSASAPTSTGEPHAD